MRLYSLLFILVVILVSCESTYKRPNILFIISDDLTATAVSSFEGTLSQTPNIDRLAKEGVSYTMAYSNYPVCGPSRASMMNGYYPHATRTFGYVSGRENIGPDRKTLPQLFKDNGYYTARVSKIFHMGVPGDIEKGTNGTDDPASWTERFNSPGPEWKAEGEAELVQGNPDGSIERRGGNVMTIVKASGDELLHSDGLTSEKACKLISLHKDKPFFLAIGFVRPHVPFVAPEKYFDPYPYANIIMPDKIPGDWDDIPERGINYVTSLNGQMNTDQQKKAVAAYYASVSFMDAQVGKVLQRLRDEGLEDNTIIIFTSDHGFHLGEHDFWMKVSLHEESVRVPLIIKVPGKDPAICKSFVELLDLYPTIADLAGLPYSNQLQGKSIKNTISNPTSTVRDTVFSVSQGGRTFLLRTEEWAYIQYDEDAKSGLELYDMLNDPKQYHNLAKETEYIEICNNFNKYLLQKLQKVRTNDLGLSYK